MPINGELFHYENGTFVAKPDNENGRATFTPASLWNVNFSTKVYEELATSTAKIRRISDSDIGSLTRLRHRIFWIKSNNAGEIGLGNTMQVGNLAAKPIYFPTYGDTYNVTTAAPFNGWVKRGSIYGLVYDNALDGFILLNPQNQYATLTGPGIVKLENSIDSDSTTTAVVPAALKAVAEAAEDLAETKAPVTTQVYATLPVGSWVGANSTTPNHPPYTQTVTIAGITPTTTGIATLPPSTTSAVFIDASSSMLQVGGQGNGTLTILAEGTKPSNDIDIMVTIFGDETSTKITGSFPSGEGGYAYGSEAALDRCNRSVATNTATGRITTVRYTRSDLNTLYMLLSYSNPITATANNGKFRTATQTFYAKDGTTAVERHVWTLSYTTTGNIESASLAITKL